MNYEWAKSERAAWHLMDKHSEGSARVSTRRFLDRRPLIKPSAAASGFNQLLACFSTTSAGFVRFFRPRGERQNGVHRVARQTAAPASDSLLTRPDRRKAQKENKPLGEPAASPVRGIVTRAASTVACFREGSARGSNAARVHLTGGAGGQAAREKERAEQQPTTYATSLGARHGIGQFGNERHAIRPCLAGSGIKASGKHDDADANERDAPPGFKRNETSFPRGHLQSGGGSCP